MKEKNLPSNKDSRTYTKKDELSSLVLLKKDRHSASPHDNKEEFLDTTVEPSSSIASGDRGEKIPHIEIATNQVTTQVKASKLGDIESEMIGIVFKEKEEDRTQISSSLRQLLTPMKDAVQDEFKFPSSLRQRLAAMEIDPEQGSLTRSQDKVQDGFRFPLQEEILDDNEHISKKNIGRTQRLHDQWKIKRIYQDKHAKCMYNIEQDMRKRKKLRAQLFYYKPDMNGEKKLKELEQRIKLTRTRAKEFEAKASDIKVIESKIHNLSKPVEGKDRLLLSSSHSHISTGDERLEELEQRVADSTNSENNIERIQRLHDEWKTLTLRRMLYKDEYAEYMYNIQRDMRKRKKLRAQILNNRSFYNHEELKSRLFNLEERIKLTRTRAKRSEVKATDIKVLESEIHNLSKLIEEEDRNKLSSSLRHLLGVSSIDEMEIEPVREAFSLRNFWQNIRYCPHLVLFFIATSIVDASILLHVRSITKQYPISSLVCSFLQNMFIWSREERSNKLAVLVSLIKFCCSLCVLLLQMFKERERDLKYQIPIFIYAYFSNMVGCLFVFKIVRSTKEVRRLQQNRN
jgi:ribosome-associated protein YbcJ (S4-like RNA binding protein)